MSNVVEIDFDLKTNTLYEQLDAVISDHIHRNPDVSILTILGTLELLKCEYYRDCSEEG